MTEGGETELKLIRMGGTAGRVAVEVKAIDVSAKYGVDYDVKIGFGKLKQDKEYKGTLIEDYLSESGDGYITSDKITTGEIYKQIIGYDEEASKLSDEEAADLSDASVGLISDTLGVTPKKSNGACRCEGRRRKKRVRSLQLVFTRAEGQRIRRKNGGKRNEQKRQA